MNKRIASHTPLLAAALGLALIAVAGSAAAQSSRDRDQRSEERRGGDDADNSKSGERYPNATREAPENKTSGNRTASKMREMMDLFEAKKGQEATVVAEAVLADEATTPYEKALAAQIAGHVAFEAGDTAKAVQMLGRAIELDALDNDNHFNMMLNLAQLQQQQKQYAESLETYDRFFAGSGSADPEAMMMKGQALLLMERNGEAAAIMQKAIEASESPDPRWQSLLMQAHARSGNTSGAVAMAEQVAGAKPDDRRAQLNLAAVYQQAGMEQKALSVLEALRSKGQLSEPGEYQQLYATYANLDGKEAEVIEVIEDGLAKGILKKDFNVSIALAQAYYFSGKIAPAVDAYRTAAPLDRDGSTFLNLAKILRNEGRGAEAAAAARQALEKGIDDPASANEIISASGG